MKRVFIFFLLFFSFFCNPVFAQANRELINVVKGIAYTLAGLFIVIGSYKIITSEGEPGKVEEGKRTIIYALIGLAVALAVENIVVWMNWF